MGVLGPLPAAAIEDLNKSLAAYLSAKQKLIETSTSVLGSFVSEEFIGEMQAGTIALLDGIADGGDGAGVAFQRATGHFEKMAINGGLELADEYIDALTATSEAEDDEDSPLPRNIDLGSASGLFPERQEALTDPFNMAVVLFNRVKQGALTGQEALERIIHAVHLLRDSELALGGISPLDVAERVFQRKQRVITQLAELVAWTGMGFLTFRAIVKVGGLTSILQRIGVLT